VCLHSEYHLRNANTFCSVKFRPSRKQTGSPSGLIETAGARGDCNTSLSQGCINTPTVKRQTLAFKVISETPSPRRHQSAIPIAQLQSTEVHRATVEAAPPVRFLGLHTPGSPTSSGTFPRSFLPLPRSPAKSSKASSLVFRSPISPRGKLGKIFELNKPTDTANQPLPPIPVFSKGRAPILFTQLRADERQRKESETQMAKKGKKKTKTIKNADTVPEPVAETLVQDKPELVVKPSTLEGQQLDNSEILKAQPLFPP
jgi:hypothetical protein